MTVAADVQKLEPGPLLEFFEVDATSFSGGVLRFQGFDNNIVTWQGQEYAPWPSKAEGFELTGQQQSNPKLRVANIDGSISLLCLAYEDMVGAKVTRRRTFKQYLDAVNFVGGNPTADPTQALPDEIWYIERKPAETQEFVEFELASAMDFGDIQLPGRPIIANYCSFVYRGPYCNYTGDPVAMVDDTPTSDPLLDDCSRKLSGCKLRLWPDGVLNFGGFPSAGLVRN